MTLVLNSETRLHYYTGSVFSPTLLKKSRNSVRKLQTAFVPAISFGYKMRFVVRNACFPTGMHKENYYHILFYCRCVHSTNMDLLLEEERTI